MPAPEMQVIHAVAAKHACHKPEMALDMSACLQESEEVSAEVLKQLTTQMQFTLKGPLREAGCIGSIHAQHGHDTSKV